MQRRQLPAHKFVLEDLEARGLYIEKLLYSTTVAKADAATYREAVGKSRGPILVCALMKARGTEERILINAYTSSPPKASGDYVHDPEARLYWGTGMAVSKDTNSVFDSKDGGPTYGSGPSLALFQGGAATGNCHSLLAGHASYPDFNPSTATAQFHPNASQWMDLEALEVYEVAPRDTRVLERNLLQRTVDHLHDQGLKVGKVLYNTEEGSVRTAQAWHAQVDEQGPTVSCLKLQHPTTQEVFVVNALAMESWKSGGANQADPKAALIWPGGKAVSKNANSIHCRVDYGPTFGNGHSLYVNLQGYDSYIRAKLPSFPDYDPSTALTQFPSGTAVKMNVVSLVTFAVVPVDTPDTPDPMLAAIVTPRDTPPPAAPAVPPPLPLRFAEGPAAMLENFGNESFVRAQVVGPPNSGKSELAGCLASVLSGRPQLAFLPNGSDTVGQGTKALQCRPMIKMFARGAASLLAQSGKELYFVDNMGFTNATVLAAALLGMQRQGEVMEPSNAGSVHPQVLARGCDPTRMVHCVILCIRASALVDPDTPANREYLDQVMKILAQCGSMEPSDFDLGSAGKPGYQIQVLPVITCVDKLVACDGKSVDFLDDSAVKATLEQACERAGIPTRCAVFTGWLTKVPPNGYGDMSDPRVQALWTVLCRSVSAGVNTKAMMDLAGYVEPTP